MPRIRLNKTELKKQQLQAEVERVRREQTCVLDAGQRLREALHGGVALLAEEVGLEPLVALERVEVEWANIAGVPIPVFVQAHLRIAP